MSIIEYLADNPEGKTSDIASYVDLGTSGTRDYLRGLVDEGIIETARSSNKNKDIQTEKGRADRSIKSVDTKNSNFYE
ncbi:MAG: hypothetical protein E7220_06225 [Clostridiales bacterium]|nr:hypothetical protein [Clostridiales bacterium]